MSTEPPLVSIVIPTFNYGQYVTEAVDSALAQTYRAIEVIVVDDGSTDDTKARLAPYTDRIRYIYQDNAGLSAARNTGILLRADDISPYWIQTTQFHPRGCGSKWYRLRESDTGIGIVTSRPNEGPRFLGGVARQTSIPQRPVTLDEKSSGPGSREAVVFWFGRSVSIGLDTSNEFAVRRRQGHVDPDRHPLSNVKLAAALVVLSPDSRAACPETPSGWSISSAWCWTRRSECRSWRDDGGCGGRQWGWRRLPVPGSTMLMIVIDLHSFVWHDQFCGGRCLTFLQQ